jgi:His/Glu/Gln/Arg/opine family amino acid ABC transporter permease subunit
MTSRRIGPDVSVLEAEREPPPERAAVGAVQWMRDNLFSTIPNTILTIIVLAIVVAFVRGVLGFIFGVGFGFERPKWGSVTHNITNYMVFAYPREELWRAWLSVGVVVGLFGVTRAAWGKGNATSVKALVKALTGVGGGILGLALIGGPIPLFWADSPLSLRAAAIVAAIGLVVIVGAQGLNSRLGGDDDEATVPRYAIYGGLVALLVVIVWIIQVPKPGLDAAGEYEESIGFLATSTKGPLTLLALVTVAGFALGLWLKRFWSETGLRRTLLATWFLSYPLVIFVIMRDPAIDWGRVASRDIWVALGFAVGGGLLMRFIADPAHRDRGRLLGGLVALATVAMFWPIGIGGMVRNMMVLAMIFAFMAPSFSGSPEVVRRLLRAWVGTVVVVVIFMTVMETDIGFQISKESFLGGLLLTIVLAVGAVGLAFPIAILLALGRTSKMPIFRQISIGYVELIRGVPLIVWLIMGVNLFGFFVPQDVELDSIVRVLAAFTIFWAAYLAENIRGGLQAIRKGQVEAAQALGMTTVQTTSLIVLPQALRLVIPPIVGQVITSFKDTSLVTIVGVNELLNVAIKTVPVQSDPFKFAGTIAENLLFVSAIYWVFTFTISRSSQRLEAKLGVGER